MQGRGQAGRGGRGECNADHSDNNAVYRDTPQPRDLERTHFSPEDVRLVEVGLEIGNDGISVTENTPQTLSWFHW